MLWKVVWWAVCEGYLPQVMGALFAYNGWNNVVQVYSNRRHIFLKITAVCTAVLDKLITSDPRLSW
jgi:hypothetical protein